MKSQRLLASSFISVGLLLCAGPAAAQGNQRPHFVPESLAAFGAAYEKHHHHSLDAIHSDVEKFHAYKVIMSGSSAAVVARSVTVDAAGHLRIIGEPGTVTRGQTANGPGELHILLPVTAMPPQ
jgi:hypothetical protein